MLSVLKGKLLQVGTFVLRDTMDADKGVAIEDTNGRIIGYIYGSREVGAPHITIKSVNTNQVNRASETVFTLKPKEPVKRYCHSCGQEIGQE